MQQQQLQYKNAAIKKYRTGAKFRIAKYTLQAVQCRHNESNKKLSKFMCAVHVAYINIYKCLRPQKIANILGTCQQQRVRSFKIYI